MESAISAGTDATLQCMGHKYASERKLPHRDEERHAQPEVPLHRAKKNTKRWCKGKVGREHKVELGVSKNGWGRRQCEYVDWLRWLHDDGWMCRHVRSCTVCGKVMEYSLGRECPDWKPR